MNIIKNRKN